MCKYCDLSTMTSIGSINRIHCDRNYTVLLKKHAIVFADADGQAEVYINNCPMCGRNLKGE